MHRAQSGVQALQWGVKLVRKKKRIGLACIQNVGVGACPASQQGLVFDGGRHAFSICIAHHALSNAFGVHAGVRRQRALHQQFADTHPKTATHQFDQQKTAPCVQLAPVGPDAQGHLVLGQAAQRQQPVFNPIGQAQVRLFGVQRQNVGDGFCQVADRLVTLFKQPVRNACRLAGQRAQQCRPDHLARLAARQKIHGPGGVLGRRAGEIALQRLDLGVGGCGAVQLREQPRKMFHGVAACVAGAIGLGSTCSSTGSSPYSVWKASACRPCSVR